MFDENPTATPTARSNVALIVGVTGITGLSLVESLLSPSSPGAPWTIYGAARRPPPPSLPLPTTLNFLQLDALDPSSTHLALFPLSPRITHLFYVAASPALSADHNAAMLANVLRSLPALRHVSLQTGSMHYFGTAAAAPFREDSPRGARPHFYHALEDVVGSAEESSRGAHPDVVGARGGRMTWTVHRPSAILGGSVRSGFNLVLTLAVYAIICRRERGPLVYPGNEYTWRNVCCDASDAGMVAEQEVWAAAGNPTAENEAFNCTNGDAFKWGRLWEVVAGEFGVGHVAGGGEGREWVDRMKGKGGLWDLIVEEEELVRTELDEIANFEYLYQMTNLEFEMVSCNGKSWEFGFDRRVDTMESVRKWIGRLRGMNVIPKN